MFDKDKIDECDLFSAFFNKDFRRRFKITIHTDKGRRKFISKLSSTKPFDPKIVIELDRSLLMPDNNGLFELLKKEGAPEECYCMTNTSGAPSGIVSLKEALHFACLDSQNDILICCIPGKLGFFADEGNYRVYLLKLDDVQTKLTH